MPDSMKRSMSRQAERERRARVIAADREFQAADKLVRAADRMAATPSPLQLRLPQTVVDVAAEKNSTLVMSSPVELLRFFEHATGEAHRNGAATTGALSEMDNAEGILNGVTHGSAQPLRLSTDGADRG
jgi:hypothetical protein